MILVIKNDQIHSVSVLSVAIWKKNKFPRREAGPPPPLGEAGRQGACYRNRHLFVLFVKPCGLRDVWLVFPKCHIPPANYGLWRANYGL